MRRSKKMRSQVTTCLVLLFSVSLVDAAELRGQSASVEGLESEIQSAESVSAQRPPNIILFVVDDMGWQDTSVEFHTQRTVWNDLCHTPNMEKLAARGMRFRNAYASHPVCSPTRVSFMTGMNPARSGVDDWVGHGQSKNRYLKSPEWRSKGLQPGDGITTLPTILKKHG